MQIKLTALITICALCFACAPRGEAPESTATTKAAQAADDLVGSWRLISWTRTTEDGETIHPYGQDVFGRILYQPNGKMAAILMRRERPRVSSDRNAELGSEERATLAQGFFAYSGRYVVDEEQGTVTHHVEACLNPNWVGSERVRKLELVGDDRIALSPAEMPLPTELVWEREN